MTNVLDHGYVKLIESYGSDERIIEAARMSTDGGFKGWGPQGWRCSAHFCFWKDTSAHFERHVGDACPTCKSPIKAIPGDEGLLKYLYTHKHMTPFEMGGMIIEVQAPIFVFREWHRHRTQSYNEMSARYIPMPDVNYMPTPERLMVSGGSNKQAQGSKPVDEHVAWAFKNALAEGYERAQTMYEDALANGVPKELARLIIPVGRYSKMRASANLRNWLAFMTLRCDTSAQWEIREYANVVANLIKQLFPRTYELWAA